MGVSRIFALPSFEEMKHDLGLTRLPWCSG